MKELSLQDSQLLESFLQQLSLTLSTLPAAIPVNDRYQILFAIREDLLSSYQHQVDMAATLKHFVNHEQLLNHHLAILGYAPIKVKKKIGCFRTLLLVFLGCIFVGIFLIWLLLKSIFPLFDFDEAEYSLTLFGRPIELSQHWKGVANQLDGHQLNAKLNADIDLRGVQTITLQMQTGEIMVTSALDTKLALSCQSQAEETNLVDLQGEKINLQLKNLASCQLFIPKGKDLVLHLNQGSVLLKNLRNNLQVENNNGTITWVQKDKHYYTRPQVSGPLTSGELSGFGTDREASYHCQLTVTQGEVKVR